VQRFPEDFICRRGFNDLPRVHYRNPIGYMFRNTEIMRDEKEAKAFVLPKTANQLQDPSLHRDVQGGGRFIKHHKLGTSGQCAGDRDALTLAAAKFVRVPPQKCLVKPYPIQHSGSFLESFTPFAEMVSEEWFN
jgi:hypothetical protein